ncbi:threonylcarbamoyl-AMP synthase [bacterium]|nr:threonylcarbamoyl-AMP synthase [bacterium]RQV93460.1 MAG: threonylcarbamoyl-AMP synthase [bacterium]
MNIVRIDPKNVDAESIEKVVDHLRCGGIIGYPTDTVYGLGGDGMNEDVIDQIYRLKGRSTQYPFPLLVGRAEDVSRLTRTISFKAEVLMEQFWPGPLTLVFSGSRSLSSLLTGKEGKVGLRLSSDPICQAILMKFEKPLISTSANPSGHKPAQSASQVFDYFGNQVDLILDGGEKKAGVPSTVIDVSGTLPKIIREGAISKGRIEKVIGPLNGS